ncbi:MAG: hypothetical protein WCC26_19335 [Terracidiphilus sp.]
MPLEVQGLPPLLSVFDRSRALHFYRDLLGFKTTATSPHLSANPDSLNWSILALNGTALMLKTATDSASSGKPEHHSRTWSDK